MYNDDDRPPVAPPYAYDDTREGSDRLPLRTRLLVQLALIIVTWAAVLALMVSLVTAAQAAPTAVCAPRAQLLRELAARHGEQPMLELTGSAGETYSLLLNAQTLSWTLLGHGRKVSCIVAVGRGVAAASSANDPT